MTALIPPSRPSPGAEVAKGQFASAGVAQHRAGHGEPEGRDRAQGVLAVHDRLVFERRAGAGVEEVQRHLVGFQGCELGGEFGALLEGFAHADQRRRSTAPSRRP